MKKKAAILFLLRILKIGLGIFNLSLSAKYFGVSVDRDVWILAFNTLIILDTALWGPINETFRAKFIFIRENEGEEAALMQTRSLLLFIGMISAIVVVFVVCYPQLLAKLIAPTYEGNDLALLLKMIVLVAPCFLINQIVQISISILNAYESFYVPEISSTITVVINLLLLIFLAPIIGIYSLLISYYAGVLLLIIFILFQLRKLKINLFSNWKAVKLLSFLPFILFSLPFFFPYFLGQISAVIEKTISSSLGIGVVSIIDYSRKFTDILMSVISTVLTTILVPALSLHYMQKNKELFVDEFKQIMQIGLLALTVIIALFTACPEAFVHILYAKGFISPESLDQIASLIRLYSFTCFAIFIYLIFGMSLLSSGDGKNYAFWGVIAQVLNIVINLALFKKFDVYVFPVSLFISHLIIGVIMVFKFPYLNRALLITAIKYTSILMASVALLFIINYLDLIPSNAYFKILTNTFIILLALITQLFIFKLDERRTLQNVYFKLIGGKI